MTLDLDTLVLRSGTHASPSDGVSLMGAVSALAGEPWSNSPSCTSPVIAAYARSLGNWLLDDERQRLKPYIPRLVGTAKPDLVAWPDLHPAGHAVGDYGRPKPVGVESPDSRSDSPPYDRPMLSLPYLVVRALARLVVGGRDDGSKHLGGRGSHVSAAGRAGPSQNYPNPRTEPARRGTPPMLRTPSPVRVVAEP